MNEVSLATVVTVIVLVFFVVVVLKCVRVVPQQYAWVVERLGRFHRVLEPGLNWIVPFFDNVPLTVEGLSRWRK